MAKIVQNLTRLLTTFAFDREYCRNGSTLSKIGKALENLEPLPSWTKKVGVLRSINDKVIDYNVFTP